MVGSRFFIINRITRQSLQGLVMNMNKLFIPLLLVTVFLAVSCSDDEPKDVVNEIKMSVSAETGTYIPWGSDTSVECMLVMSEDNPGYGSRLDLIALNGLHTKEDMNITFRWSGLSSPILQWMVQTEPIL